MQAACMVQASDHDAANRVLKADQSGRSEVVLFSYLKVTSVMQAASMVQASDHDCKLVVFLSDALSVLLAYQNHKLPNLATALQQAAATRRAVVQWIPALCGTSGNEQVDIPAKKGARGKHLASCVSFSEKKTHQSAHKAKITEGWLSPAVPREASHSGEALTGHNSLNSHMDITV